MGSVSSELSLDLTPTFVPKTIASFLYNISPILLQAEKDIMSRQFDDAQDAEDAIRGRDGYDFNGRRLRVEAAHGGRGTGNSSSRDRHSSQSNGRGGRGVSRRSEYRVLVSGLPSSASWQDLKDHMRKAGDVSFSQVFSRWKGYYLNCGLHKL
ncbi:hypothetical protein RYX36_007226 [Vicia faba]